MGKFNALGILPAIAKHKVTIMSGVPTIYGVLCANPRAGEYDLRLFACLADKTIPLRDSLSGFGSGRVIVFIGPEGDFTPEEISLAEKSDCRMVSLGKRVLKSDTAGLFVLSVLGYEFFG
jgi:16S rRNA (uracil1498-N3)-methyltransferase